VLSQDVYGTPDNGITKLYAQFLAAKFNKLNGASIYSVQATFVAADAFLATHDYTTWAALSAADQALVLSWHGILDSYNNGNLAPAHCE
jgi:hypothetical protein